MHKSTPGKRDARIQNESDRSGARKSVRFQDSSPARVSSNSGSSMSADKKAQTQSHSSSTIGVQAVLCGVLIAIVAGASFGRVYRSTRPAEDLSPAIKAYVDRTVVRAMRDAVGRRDYALYANGGRVIHDLTAVFPAHGHAEQTTSVANSHADLAISEETHVGQCWLFPSSSAQLGLRLSELLHPTHVSIDHIPAEIALDIGGAPRAMVLWGAIDGSANALNVESLSDTAIPGLRGRTEPHITCNHTYIPLASFEYDIRAPSNVQTFGVHQHVIDAGVYTGVVVLEVLGNWGGTSTCLYRVRIHGDPRGDAV